MSGLFEYVYDYFINKYGLMNFAERKMKEMIISVIRSRRSSPKIELFARFLGLSEVQYSLDDLDFFFNIGILFQNATVGYTIKKGANAFDANPFISFDDSIELIRQFFLDKSTSEQLAKMNNKVFLTKIKVTEDKYGMIDIYIIYMNCIDFYKELKEGIFTKILNEMNIKTDKIYSEYLISIKDVISNR